MLLLRSLGIAIMLHIAVIGVLLAGTATGDDSQPNDRMWVIWDKGPEWLNWAIVLRQTALRTSALCICFLAGIVCAIVPTIQARLSTNGRNKTANWFHLLSSPTHGSRFDCPGDSLIRR
jgi:hypothetical protein